jgi:hypothetical protein
VLKELLNFVRQFKRSGGLEEPSDDEYDDTPRRSSGATTSKQAGGGGRKKNKPMSAREQEAKIALYQQKLQEFDAGAGGDAYDGESFITEILK